MIKVIKRDGRTKDYDLNRIKEAIYKAEKEIYNGTYLNLDYNPSLFNSIDVKIYNLNKEKISIEKIQDIIIQELKLYDKTVAKAYKNYRDERTFQREKHGDLDKEVENIINSISEESTANGNVDGSKIQSIRALISNVVGRNYSERHYIPKKFLKKQRKELYYHDAYYFGLPFFNCCLADWIDMFEKGFELGSTKIETPKSLATAINVLSQVASHVSSNTFGGTTFPGLIKGLTPYAKKSLEKHKQIAINEHIPDIDGYSWRRLKKEIEDSIQSLEYEVQTLVTSRGEVPFLTEEIDKIDLNADEETQKIQKMLTKAILNQRIKGLTGGVTPVFPKLVYQVAKGNNLNPEDPYYDLFKLAIRCSSLRQYPDYTMTDKVIEVTGDYKPPMGKQLLPM